MSSVLQLQADDGFSFSVYVSKPQGVARGAIVVLQEIFGVNSHIRAVADDFAAQGYVALAPATFERVQRGVDLGYADADRAQGIALKAAVEALPAPGVQRDIQATIVHGAQYGKVGLVGYCWGGLLTWRAACGLEGLAAAVPYYGGGMTAPAEAARQPRCAVQAHFGEQDQWIPLDSVRAFAQAQPTAEVHVYAANHAFHCDQRASFDAQASASARARTLAFFAKHLG